MKLRLALVLAVLVLAPLASLAWLGARFAADARAEVVARFDEVVRARLAEQAAAVGRLMGEKVKALVAATDGFPEEPGDIRDPRLAAVTAEGDRRENEKDDDGDTVIEEALAGDLRLQLPSNTDRLEHPEHGHGIGRTDERAEDESDDERNAGEPVERETDDEGGDQKADRGGKDHHPFLVGEIGEIDVQRAGEQDETQHPVHQRLVEIDAGDEGAQVRHQRQSRYRPVEPHRPERCRKSHDDEADGRRQAQDDMVDPAERRGEHDQDRRDLEDGHGHQYPSARPSFLGSEPPISTPRS